MRKKIIAVILSIVVCLSLFTGCSLFEYDNERDYMQVIATVKPITITEGVGSDMKTYTEEMRKIRAEEAARRNGQPSPPVVSSRDSLQTILTNLLSGLETGSIDGLITDQLASSGADSDAAPLATEENLILVLDRKHILMVPGDRDLLHEALERWRDFVDRRGAAAPDPAHQAGWLPPARSHRSGFPNHPSPQAWR